MFKYYKNNLVEAYRTYLLACTLLVALAGIGTLYIVVNNYKSYASYMKSTYVYSSTGASIEVNNKTEK